MNQILNMILNRLDSIDLNMKDFKEYVENSINTLNTRQEQFEETQNSLIAKQEQFEETQKTLIAKQDEILREQKAMRKDILDLRDDVDTVYTVQKENHKTLQKHTAILNKHTEQLNLLIQSTEKNKEEHIQFDKRISKLEALIS